MRLYACPSNSPPLYEFLMKGGENGKEVLTVFDPHEHIHQDFSHEPWILDKSAGVFNVGSPFFVRIGYEKKSKTQNLSDESGAIDINDLQRSPFKWENPFYDIEHSHRRCAEESIANLLYHLGDTDIYEAIKLSVNETDVSKIYHIATGCVHNDSVQKPPGVVKGN